MHYRDDEKLLPDTNPHSHCILYEFLIETTSDATLQSNKRNECSTLFDKCAPPAIPDSFTTPNN